MKLNKLIPGYGTLLYMNNHGLDKYYQIDAVNKALEDKKKRYTIDGALFDERGALKNLVREIHQKNYQKGNLNLNLRRKKIMKKAITLTIFSMFILAGCMRQDIYDYYIPLQEISFNIYKQDKNCNHLLYKSINMEISHESLDLRTTEKIQIVNII
ncbi:MAG: hypothetical protein IPG89_17835 [Bacteroidetes bacterium]|nr:hypothetical protein [Bacteroidota bacterium]